MASIRANRKEIKKSNTSKALVRSSTAGRDKPIRLDTLTAYDNSLKMAEDDLTNTLMIQTRIREATTSANRTLKERGYEDLMDQHALQIFLVRHGKVIDETPEFQSFKRLAGKRWEKVAPYLKLLLKCINRLELKLVRINGSDLLKISLMHSKPSIPLVMRCLIAADSDENEGETYLAELKRYSVIKIQAFIRMKQAIKRTRRLKILNKKIMILQNWFRAVLSRKKFKRGKADRDNEIWRKFEALQEEFKETWSEIKQVSRVEIHYTGFNGSELWKLGIDNLGGRTSSQIGRIFRAMQDKLEVIYVSEKEVPDEVKKYYYKIMELAGLKLGQKRVHFLSLDPFQEFPSHFSMASRILYSRSTLKKIKRVAFF